MNYKTTLLLVIMLALVGGFFWWARSKAPTSLTPPVTSGPRDQGQALFTADAFDAQAVDRITLSLADRRLVLAKQGADWWQVEPVHFPLNTWSARDLVDDAAALRYVEKFAPGRGENPTAAQLEIDPPRATIRFVTAGDTPWSHTLHLGRKGLGGRAYVRLGDGPDVYVVGNRLHNLLLDADPASWRKRTLEAPTAAAAQRVVLEQGDVRIELVKRDGLWSFAPPHAGRAGADAISSLLGTVGGLYINKFVADAPADLALYGLDRPRLTLNVEATAPTTGDDPAASEADASTPDAVGGLLRIGAATDLSAQQHFAAWTSDRMPEVVVFEIGQADLDKLARQVDDLRDPRISVLAGQDIRRLEVRAGEHAPYALEWTAQGWRFADPGPGFAADSGEAAALVQSLSQVKAIGYLSDGQAAVEPLATLTLHAVGRSEPEVLRIFAGDGPEQVVARRNQETVGYQVPAESLARFLQPAAALRERTVWNILPSNVASLRLTRADGEWLLERDPPPAEAAERGPGSWRLAGHERFEQPAVAQLVRLVAPLRAQRWVSADGPGTADGLMELEVRTFDGRQWQLRIRPDNRHAVSSGVDGVFEVGVELMDALAAELRERTALGVRPDQISRVIAVREGVALSLRKTEAGSFVSDEGTPVDQSAAAGLFDALAGLRVERYLPDAPMGEPTLTVELADGRSVRLAAAAGDGFPRRMAMDGDLGRRTFSVDAATWQKLTGPVVAAADEAAK